MELQSQDRPSWLSNLEYEADGLKKSLHGNDYQLKLLMLCAWEARESEVAFRLATEMNKAEKFDDLVLRYIDADCNIHYHFLQAKHRQFLNDKNKIEVNNLTSTSDDEDFSLKKYFVSYMKIIQNSDFQDGSIDDFVICTNTDFNFESSRIIKERQITLKKKERWKTYLSKVNKNNYFNLGGQLYKFSKDTSIRRQIIEELKEIFQKSWKKKILPNEIEEFIEHLVFAVNQKSGRELEQVIKEKIGKEFALLNDITYKAFFDYMSKWMQYRTSNKKAHFLVHEDLQVFISEAKKEIASLGQMSSNYLYQQKLEKLGIWFKETNKIIQCMKRFLNGEKNYKILIIHQKNTYLSGIKVYQALTSLEEKIDEYIFANLTSLLLLLDTQADPVSAFKSSQNNKLIVEITSLENKQEEQLLKSFFEIILKMNKKKIILVTFQKEFIINLIKELHINENMYADIEDKENGFNDLTDKSQTKLLENTNMIFQGKKTRLGHLIDESSKHLIDSNTLAKIISEKKLKISKKLTNDKYEELKYYYVNRKFNRCVTIENKSKTMGKFLNKKLSKSFYVIDINSKETSLLSKNKDTILISQNEENFWDLSRQRCQAEREIHWFKKIDDKFVWQMSQGSLQKLRKFVRMNDVKQSDKTSKIIMEIEDNEKVIIIDAASGMGKSSLMTHMANQFKSPSIWILLINLPDYSTELKNLKEKDLNESEAIKFLCRTTLMNFEKKDFDFITVDDHEITLKYDNGKNVKNMNLFEIKLFIHFYNNNATILLFDGFDEISPDHKEVVIKLLKILKRGKCKQIWVTTRPYGILRELEIEMNTFCYQLLPFSSDDIISFFEKFWRYELGEIEHNQVVDFIKKVKSLLPPMKSKENKLGIQEHEFMSIPLHTYMIATVLKKEFNKFHNNLDICLQNLDLNLITLYKGFIKIKLYDIQFGEKNPGICKDNPYVKGIIEKELLDVIENHKKLAAYALFDEIELRQVLNEREINQRDKLFEMIEKAIEKIGICDQIVGNKPRFIHQSFAEYFAAELIAAKLTSNSSKEIWDFFINILLIKEKFKNVRLFFNTKLKLDDTLTDLSDEMVFKNIISNLLVEEMNSGSLYIIAAEGLANIFDFLLRSSLPQNAHEKDLENLIKIIKSDDINDSLLCVAINNGHNEIVKILVKHIISIDPNRLVEIINDDKGYPLHLAIETENYGIVDILLQNINEDHLIKIMSKQNEDGQNLVHQAAICNNIKILVDYLKKLSPEQCEELFHSEDYDGFLPAQHAANDLDFDFFFILEDNFNKDQYAPVVFTGREENPLITGYFPVDLSKDRTSCDLFFKVKIGIEDLYEDEDE